MKLCIRGLISFDWCHPQKTRSAQTCTFHACTLSFICHKRSLANYQYSMHTRLHTTYIKCVYNSLRVHEMMHMKCTTLCVVLVHKGNCKRIAYRLWSECTCKSEEHEPNLNMFKGRRTKLTNININIISILRLFRHYRRVFSF